MKSTLNTRDIKDLKGWIARQAQDAFELRDEHAKQDHTGWTDYYQGQFIAYSDVHKQIDRYLAGEITNFAYASATAEDLREGSMKITQVERKAGNGNDTVLIESNINYIYSSRDESREDAYVLISLAPSKKGAQHRFEIELDLADARKIAEDLAQWVKYYESPALGGSDERDYLVGEGY